MMRNFYLVLFIIFAFFNSFNVLAKSKLADLSFVDNALSTCITEQAQKHNWQAIKDIHTLKCHGMEITNIAGLDKLTQLKSLSLFNNKLESVDLRSFNQLEYINIANNKLNTIYLTGLSHLKTLYLFKNNLSTVDFTGLNALLKIRITNNQLSSIDISPLISLEKAYFFDNNLKELIVAGLPQLTFIEVRQNPMPDEVYDRYDALEGITIVHDGNADDWK
jgi:Leucine-rich repeat (LRR) protein